MSTSKQVLRQLAVDAKELAIIKRYTKGIEAQKKFIAAANPATVLALLDELEAAERRTITVKLPADYHNADGSLNADMMNTCAVVGAFRDALAAAGITVKGDSE